MKTIVVSTVLLGLAAGAFGLISLRGDRHMITGRKDRLATGAIQPIDAQASGRIETATFALG